MLVLLAVAVGAVLLAYRSGKPRVETVSPRPPAGRGTVEFSNFSARHERSPEGERLSVALRLRTTGQPELPCFIFVLARNHSDPDAWSAWPQQNDTRAVTRTGHFHGTYPAAGYGIILTPSWERVTSTHPEKAVRYDTVAVYVVAADGRVLLHRPFRV
jgi:hypothetical protein